MKPWSSYLWENALFYLNSFYPFFNVPTKLSIIKIYTQLDRIARLVPIPSKLCAWKSERESFLFDFFLKDILMFEVLIRYLSFK